MLLNEVIKLAKKIKNIKILNESFNSSIIHILFQPILNSTLAIRNTNSYKRYNDIYDKIKYWKSYYHIRYKQLTQDIIDDPDKRREAFDIDYQYKSNNIIKDIQNYIYSQEEQHISLSDITNDDLLIIKPEEANKKPYKNCLQFWVDSNNNLKAICLNNKIIVYFYLQAKYLDVNDKYTGPTDLNKLTTDDEYLKYYIDNAFVEINHYILARTPSEIKKYIKASNIKNLIESEIWSKIYVVKPESMDTIDISEKLKTRNDWAQYLYSQLDLNIKNILRYKNQIFLNKYASYDIQIKKHLLEILDICADASKELQDIELDIILNCKNIALRTQTSLYLDNLPYTITNILSQILSNSNRISKYKHKRYQEKTYYNCYAITDIFVLINVFIQYIINKVKDVLFNINDYQQLKIDTEDTNQLASKIKNIKMSYTYLIQDITNINLQTFIYNNIYDFDKNQNIRSILQKIFNIKSNIEES